MAYEGHGPEVLSFWDAFEQGADRISVAISNFEILDFLLQPRFGMVGPIVAAASSTVHATTYNRTTTYHDRPPHNTACPHITTSNPCHYTPPRTATHRYVPLRTNYVPPRTSAYHCVPLRKTKPLAPLCTTAKHYIPLHDGARPAATRHSAATPQPLRSHSAATTIIISLSLSLFLSLSLSLHI